MLQYFFIQLNNECLGRFGWIISRVTFSKLFRHSSITLDQPFPPPLSINFSYLLKPFIRSFLAHRFSLLLCSLAKCFSGALWCCSDRVVTADLIVCGRVFKIKSAISTSSSGLSLTLLSGLVRRHAADVTCVSDWVVLNRWKLTRTVNLNREAYSEWRRGRTALSHRFRLWNMS